MSESFVHPPSYTVEVSKALKSRSELPHMSCSTSSGLKIWPSYTKLINSNSDSGSLMHERTLIALS